MSIYLIDMKLSDDSLGWRQESGWICVAWGSLEKRKLNLTELDCIYCCLSVATMLVLMNLKVYLKDICGRTWFEAKYFGCLYRAVRLAGE